MTASENYTAGLSYCLAALHSANVDGIPGNDGYCNRTRATGGTVALRGRPTAKFQPLSRKRRGRRWRPSIKRPAKGLTSCSTLHINWGGMKCQAFRSPQRDGQTPPTPHPLPPHASHSRDQIIFQPPKMCLALESNLPRAPPSSSTINETF